jgi:hypothetical protein
MQIRHARRGGEADLAFLLADPERIYGAEMRERCGRDAVLSGPTILTNGGALCHVANDGPDRLGLRHEKKVYFVMDT